MSDSLQPMDYTVHGILQARILEWAAISFSREGSKKSKVTNESYLGSLRVQTLFSWDYIGSTCTLPTQFLSIGDRKTYLPWKLHIFKKVDFSLQMSLKSNWNFFLMTILLSNLVISVLQFSSVQSLSCVRLFATPWIAASQASLSITNSQSPLKLMSIESVMPSSHLIIWGPLLLLLPSLPASESFPMSQLFAWGGQSTGVSALASFLPKKSPRIDLH